MQGDVPPFAVAVSSAEDVVATMQFAYHYNILVVVKRCALRRWGGRRGDASMAPGLAVACLALGCHPLYWLPPGRRRTPCSTGHDFQGRSTASDGLMVWTHRWKQLNMSTSFAACGGDSPVPALTVTGGVQWGDVYDYVDAGEWRPSS